MATQAQQPNSTREWAALAKQQKVAAHAPAIQLHERAAELQEWLGHPDRAATARKHAEHARRLYELALADRHQHPQPKVTKRAAHH